MFKLLECKEQLIAAKSFFFLCSHTPSLSQIGKKRTQNNKDYAKTWDNLDYSWLQNHKKYLGPTAQTLFLRCGTEEE